MKNAGFTLLEVIIAVTILASISLFTARMIQEGVKAKAKIQTEIDSRSGLNAALQLMANDIAKAFNYRDINVELHNAAQKIRRDKKLNPPPVTPPGGNPPGTPPPGGPPQQGGQQPPQPLSPEDEADFKTKEVVVYTRFIGEAEQLDFTTLDPNRPTENAKVSDQVEVGYFLDTCTSHFKKEQSSDCLWRRHSSYIDSEIKEGGKQSVVLENVKSLTFRFMGPGHEEKWTETWNTVSGEETMKNNFPYAVEITLIINDTRFSPPKEIGMTVVAPIQFPNNKPKETPTPP